MAFITIVFMMFYYVKNEKFSRETFQFFANTKDDFGDFIVSRVDDVFVLFW